MKEVNKITLDKALGQLNTYEPDGKIWTAINDGLNELPLQKVIQKLPDYRPDEKIWDLVRNDLDTRKPAFNKIWYAAATVLLASFLGFWFLRSSPEPAISISQQEVDSRLQLNPKVATDQQFNTLKGYCEAETLVCNSSDFRQLTQEYETLRVASLQLQQAIGEYNTEPDLMRQLSTLEQEKADILNKMAKMI
ncbi:hypothetical protein [Dyadobacter sp. NIV53]|uniref:hypothetical protein n=1 Tax=Dyadobacter sp. NIV53 TaxID=2861765 RepID=UPI001C87871B|nr:hypothetical protein [Dyadobacter sp. NIV53]